MKIEHRVNPVLEGLADACNLSKMFFKKLEPPPLFLQKALVELYASVHNFFPGQYAMSSDNVTDLLSPMFDTGEEKLILPYREERIAMFTSVKKPLFQQIENDGDRVSVEQCHAALNV